MVLGVSAAQADVYTFAPNANYPGDLDHSYSYDWMINLTAPTDETIANDVFRFELEPDFHYNNEGVKSTITTAQTPVVPEPNCALIALIAGVPGVIGVAQRRRHK